MYSSQKPMNFEKQKKQIEICEDNCWQQIQLLIVQSSHIMVSIVKVIIIHSKYFRFWLVKTTRIIHHKHLLLTKNSVIFNQWRQKCSPLQIFELSTSKWRQKCSPLQVIESLTSKIIEPLTEKTWAQACVIQQREKWPWVEFTSLS